MTHLRNIFRCGFIARELHSSAVRNSATIINGKEIAKEIQNELRNVVDTWVNCGGKRPKLIAILVGNHPSSEAYVSKKMTAAKEIGIESYTVRMTENIAQEDLMVQIKEFNEDPTVDGIIVQLPLPLDINEPEICQTIDPRKDVDGFHLENIGNLTLDRKAIFPATALAVKELILRTKIPTFGKNALVIGRSKHVGLPTALLLHGDGRGASGALDMTTTICHRNTPPEELYKFAQSADLIVSAAGVPKLIKKEMVKPGSCVIDVGITKVTLENGKSRLVGDVDFEEVKNVAGFITPVPGGVGPMTVAMLMKNTVNAAMRHKENLGLSFGKNIQAGRVVI